MLIGHWKLDGDAQDSSGNNNHGTSTEVSWVSDERGAVGSFNSSSTINIPYDPVFDITKQITVSAWAKMDKMPADMSSSFPLLLGKSNYTYRFGVWSGDSSKMGLRLNYTQATSFQSHYDIISSPGEWVLFSTTYDGKTMKFFENGDLIHPVRGEVTISTDSNPIVIGSGWEGKIYDVRLYNHALSHDDIKWLAQPELLTKRQEDEINKQKILHYGFDKQPEPTTNVVTNTNLDTGWSKTYQQNILWNDIDPPPGVNSPVVSSENDDTSGNGYWFSYGDYAPQADNTTYTASLWVKTNQNSNVSIYMYTADNSESDRHNSEALTVNASEGWKRLVWAPFTTANPSDSDSMSFRINGLYENGFTRLWLCAPQLEVGNHATPFVDGSRSGFVEDYSGHNNHANLQSSTMPIWTSNSITGKGAYEFNNSSIDVPAFNTPKDEITVAAWLKPSSISGDNRQWLVKDGGIGAGFRSYISNTTSKISWKINSNEIWSNTSLSTGIWYFVAFTFDGSNQIIYINGVEEKNVSYIDDIVDDNDKLFIGYDGFDSYDWYEGLITDIRIYSKALTLAEIQEIYQSPALSLDSNSNTWIKSADQGSTTKLYKTGHLEYGPKFNKNIIEGL